MSKKLWGGRFSKKTDPLVEEFTKSIQYDYKLAKYDLLGSMVHVHILAKAGYLTSGEAAKLKKGLGSILKKFEKPGFKPAFKEEDIHTYIQNELQKYAGDMALKLHTARSRNDQVAFATKVYCKAQIQSLRKDIEALMLAALELAKRNTSIIMPGVTHMQHAQPVFLTDHLTAYVEMLERDASRLDRISNSIRISMGAGALSGTPIDNTEYNIKCSDLIKGVGIQKSLKIWVTVNSLDTVSDRDFIIEIIGALSIMAMHLSRMAEDLIIWSTKEFDFIDIDEAFCTGSSLMPQKKNPDSLELIRGNTGRFYGNLMGVLTMMKALPLTYNRDMQLDKEPLFDCFETASKELRILAGLVGTLKFNNEKIRGHLKDEALYATDLVYYLVDKHLPFKEAHSIVGNLVKYSLERNTEIKDMGQNELELFSGKFVKREIAKLFDPAVSVSSKKSIKRVSVEDRIRKLRVK